MQRANVDEITLEYEIAGSGEPVICIHGAGIAGSFLPLLSQPDLTDKFQIVMYHRRGYAGSSPITEQTTINQQAADCRALLQYLDVERAHVAGHSLGGVIALQLALDYPEVVRSLVLLEPALMVGASAQGYRESLQQGIQQLQESGAASVIDDFFTIRFGENFRTDLEETVPGGFEQAVDDAATSFEYELPALLDWNFGESEARRIQQPTLAVIGEWSKELSPRFEETYDALLQWIPDAEGFTLPNAAHGMQMQNPSGTALVLAHFFSRHPIER